MKGSIIKGHQILGRLEDDGRVAKFHARDSRLKDVVLRRKTEA
jgi:hypothetical protein